ncbi:MAG: flavodoxin family protein [Desulfohalobiaceae bacterium]|nr:flavodoxin family protein [Desulfohalobiaceae bacterium]
MTDIVAIYGSPRRKGNTAQLLARAVQGARDNGSSVREYALHDLELAPCKEIYACKKDGECAIKDDFQQVRDALLEACGVMLASPIFFYSVTGQTKVFMDRFQSLWVKKYLIDQTPFGQWTPKRKGYFISVGATRGKKLFDGTLLTLKYFFDTIDTGLHNSLLCRGLDEPRDVEKHPDLLQQAYEDGADLAGQVADTGDQRSET